MTDFLQSSVALHVHVRRRHDLPGLGDKLGWSDDDAILFGSVRVGHVPRM